MEEDRTVSLEIYSLLNNILNGNIEDYILSVKDENKKGEGYLGEICYLSLKNRNNGHITNLVVKQAFSSAKVRSLYPIRKYYLNEIHFYSKVWASFDKFQKDKGLYEPFDKIPKFFGSSLVVEHEKLALENLKCLNFRTYDKAKSFDNEHLVYILKQYGKFHAISFAYKYLQPQEYQELTKDLEDLYGPIAKVEPFANILKYAFDLALKGLDKIKDANVLEKFKCFIKNGVETFKNKSDYCGYYSVVLHGDCWSNNMMFKYNEKNKLCDMRLLDFQFAKIGTPVSDLSYFIYSGGSKEILDQLDRYLKIYYVSLSTTLEEFGLNAQNVFPFEELKKDWKKYSQMGFAMSMLVWRMKLICDGEAKDLNDITENEDFTGMFTSSRYDHQTFELRTRELIVHMAENGFI